MIFTLASYNKSPAKRQQAGAFSFSSHILIEKTQAAARHTSHRAAAVRIFMQDITPRLTFLYLLQTNHPQAMAWVRGGSQAPRLSGLVKFYDTPYGGILVEAEIFGLPNVSTAGSSNFYAMHIHDAGDCSHGFARTGDHYNPTASPHPDHAGDLVPLLGNQGYAWTSFYDKRFSIEDIMGRSVIIHSQPDDFTTQPSGNSGTKIGCGIIRSA